MKRRYRVVRDNYLGYEAQHWRWWWPFWEQMGVYNTHSSLEDAREFIRKCTRSYVVWQSDREVEDE